jgi:release factor glutamine methyltransferase
MVSDQDFPEEYIDGYVIFMGRRFITDKRALIPRLETEELVKYCLKLLRENASIQTVADIGTGSGIIPISIAEKIERPIQTFASDMSQEALSLAQENAQTKNTEITFLQWDLLKPLISRFGNKTPDEILITANLPYVREKEINSWLVIGSWTTDGISRRSTDGIWALWEIFWSTFRMGG